MIDTHRRGVVCALVFLSWFVTPLVSSLAAQQRKGKEQDPDAWKHDPYTLGEPEAMQRAGYVKFGTMPWGDDHDTAAIHEMMPEAKILFVETKHFRIGCALPDYDVPRSSKVRRRVTAELKKLKKILPRVKPNTRKVDRWLRLHLYAFRAESLYSEWMKMLRVTDADFPKKGALLEETNPKYMGRGPYLGMGDKYQILILNKTSNLVRYGMKAGQPNQPKPSPMTISFYGRESMLYATCTALVPDPKDTELRMHTHVLFNTSQLLVRGYKHYGHVMPAWIKEGTSNAFVIDWDKTQHDFSAMKGLGSTETLPTNWAANARRFVKNGFATPLSKLALIEMPNDMTFSDHVCAWSRIEYLRKLDGGDKFAKFMADLKAPKARKDGENPTFATVLKGQEQAFKKAFGMSYDEFDEGWGKYVLKKYPRK